MSSIAAPLLAWFDLHGRHDLPWQQPRNAYRVWLSEIMLQQTQVATARPYFERFVAALPDLQALSAAPQDQVLALWSGLGYYSRARNLQRTAQICMDLHGAELPANIDALVALPGIGRSTAAAIMAQAHNLPCAILDGNVKRVLSRYFGIHGWPGARATETLLWNHAQEQTPAQRVADYTQAIMDLGATVCIRRQPRCTQCPLMDNCVASRDGLTAALPERKPLKAKPTRDTFMLVMHDAHGRVLLQRRPPTGIWASLWSLPECDSIDAAMARLRCVGVTARELASLSPFRHSFSHYHLQVQPLCGKAVASHGVADSDDVRWCSSSDLGGLGLPAPVRKLLGNLDWIETEPASKDQVGPELARHVAPTAA